MSLSMPVWPRGPVAEPSDADGSTPALAVWAIPAVAPPDVRAKLEAVRAAAVAPAPAPAGCDAVDVAEGLPDVVLAPPGDVLAAVAAEELVSLLDALDEGSVVPFAEPIVLSGGTAASSAAVGATYPGMACIRCRPNSMRLLPIDA